MLLLRIEMDSREIRLINLQSLLKKKEMEFGHGYKKLFAEKIKTKPAYLSQMLNPNHPTGIGSALARRIENALKLPRGWMDRQHEEEKPEKELADIQINVLEAAIYAVNDYCDKEKINADATKKAKVAAALYKIIIKSDNEPDSALINALLEIL